MTMSSNEVLYCVRVHDEGPEGLWAEIEELPGCFATGDTEAELWESLNESVSLYLSTPDNPVEVKLAEMDQGPTHREVIETRQIRALH